MGLRIANNITAMNAHRWLSTSDAGMAKSLERLSSGYRINRAADDAAGLAISQGFRADIASFKVASRNTSEANSLLQVAEGGMDQVGNMLTRLKELATQAASANVSTSERSKINSEANALISEIDRISVSTKYGSTSLLDGTFGASKSGGSYSVANANVKVYGSLTHVYSIGGSGPSGILDAAVTIVGLKSTATSATYTFSATATGLTMGNGSVTEYVAATWTAGATLTFANIGLTLSFVSTTSANMWSGAKIDLKDTGLTGLDVSGASTGTWTFASVADGSVTLGNGTITETVTSISPGTATTLNFSSLGVSFVLGSTYSENNLEGVHFTVTSSGSSGSTFQVGADNTTDNRLSFSLSSLRATATAGLALTYNYFDSSTEAQSMLDLIDNAISTLAGRRGDVGAAQNRLSYAGANLATTIENVQAAESVIRDVDMASEMTTFTRNQILLQAGTAMLAQANMAPQSILSLIGG
ncbi:MAG: flagellin [Pseudomonadota bacterium]